MDDELRVKIYQLMLSNFSNRNIRKRLAKAEGGLAAGDFHAVDQALSPLMPNGFDQLTVERAGEHFVYLMEAMKIRLKGKA